MTHSRPIRVLVGIVATMLLAASIVVPPASAKAPVFLNCTDILVNGGFETQTAWILSPSTVPPQYVTSPVQSGSWAMRLGNLGQLPNLASFSSVKQTVTIPGNSVSAQISFSVWTQSQPSAGGDRQELLLLPPGATAVSQPVQAVWTELSNIPSWRQFQFAINNQIGNTVEVYFNVYNDGLGGMTGMVIDNVTLTVCQGTPLPPTPTPTMTFVPVPTITWVGNLNPNGSNPQTVPAPASLFVSVEVSAPPATGAAGQAPGVTCGLQVASVQYFGGPWSNPVNLTMLYTGDAGPNDRYGVTIGPLSAGLFQYDAWCSTNGGVTKFWSTPSNPGRLTVTGSTPGPTPGPTSVTPGPTSLPPNCQNLIFNGGFESSDGWTLGPTALMPYYTGAPNPVHSGVRSMAMGATLPNVPAVASYSSVQQTITIPASAQTAQLRFWYYPISNAAAGGLSRQEAILLDPWAFDETVAVLWRVTENTNAWTSRVLDLTPYRGRTVSVYFNARNAGNGTRTSMFLDDVEALACGGYMVAQPLPATLPGALPGTLPVATGQPLPIYPVAEQPGIALATIAPQATVLTVTTPRTIEVGSTPIPTIVWEEPPRRERKPLLGNFKLSLNPATLALIIGLIVVGAILLVVYLASRRDKDSN